MASGRGPTVGRTHDRVLLADLDSTVQEDTAQHWLREQSPDADEGALIDATVAKLRLETLLSETVVLSDVQMFDGSLVSRLLAADRLGDLRRTPGAALPVELKLRDPSPARSLWLMYHHESGVPRGFKPALLPQGTSLSSALQQLQVGWTDEWVAGREVDQCTELLTAAGADPAAVQGAGQVWRQLVGLCETGAVPTSVWQQQRSFTELLVLSEQAWTRDQLRASHCLTPAAEELFGEIVELGLLRADIHNRLTAARRAETDEEMLRAVDWIELWWDERYRRAQAYQHAADYRGSDGGVLARDGRFDISWKTDRLRESTSDRIVDIHLPAGVFELVGRLPAATWQQMVTANLYHLDRWWHTGSVDSLRWALDPFCIEADRQVGRPSSGSSRVKWFGRGFGLLAAVTSTALDLTPVGVGTAVALWVGGEVLQARAAVAPSQVSVEVTDYLDDVR